MIPGDVPFFLGSLHHIKQQCRPCSMSTCIMCEVFQLPFKRHDKGSPFRAYSCTVEKSRLPAGKAAGIRPSVGTSIPEFEIPYLVLSTTIVQM